MRAYNCIVKNDDTRFSSSIGQISVVNMKICGINELMCTVQVSRKFDGNLDNNTLCPECIHMCNETVYTYTITSSLFPPSQSVASYINESIGLNKFNIRKNYMFLSFYFENMDTDVITDYQKYTFIGLMNEGGNYIGLCFGMSFLIVLEIPYFIGLLTHSFLACKKIKW